MQSSEVVYRLNDRDEVCFANPEYDVFAHANDGKHVDSRAIVGRSLWDFVTDSTTQQLYLEALRRARAGKPVRFRIRCDSPDCKRVMDIHIARDADGLAEFRVRVVSQEPRAPLPLIDARGARSPEVLRMCGWCKKVHVSDAWLDVEDAVGQLRLFERTRQPAVTHGICDECYRAAVKRLEEADRKT